MENRKNQNTGNTANPKKTEGKMLSCMFTDRESAEQAYNELREKGYDDEDINLVMSEDARKKHFSGDGRKTDFVTRVNNEFENRDTDRSARSADSRQENVSADSRENESAADRSNKRAENTNEGYFGTLVGAGFNEEHAKTYETGINKGNIVLGIHPRNDEDAEYFRKNWDTEGKEKHN